MSNLQLNVKSVIFQIYCIGVNQKIYDKLKLNECNYLIYFNNNLYEEKNLKIKNRE
jgi:hypothetical protein